MKKYLIACLALLISAINHAQQYTGMSGLIHVPTAEVDSAGDVRIGAHFLNKEFTPDAFHFQGKYHTSSQYLSITPFSWIEIGYTFTLQKGRQNLDPDGKSGYYFKDRYFSLKLQPLKEGKWYPAIAIGTNDPLGLVNYDTPNDGKSLYFSNFYVAASKNFNIKKHWIGVHLAYRKWDREYNRKWDGLVGGLTYKSSFTPNLRVVGEYDGNSMNVGADYLLFKILLLQASLQDGKYFSGGLCLHFNLF